MNALQIFLASALILAVARPSIVSAEQAVVENREVIETTQPTQSKPVVIERQTIIIEKKEEPDRGIKLGGAGGIVSTTVDVTGHVLALPFKLVGDIIGLVF